MIGLCTVLLGTAWAFMEKGDKGGVVTPDPDKATIVFVRPSKMAFAIKPAILDENGTVLGEIRAKGWFSTTVSPGEHTFVSWGEATPTMSATVEAGEIYYVHVSIAMGAWAARINLNGMGPGREKWDELPQWLAKTRRWTVHDADAAAYGEHRSGDVKVVLEKGDRVWGTYDAEAQRRRSLSVDDGVRDAVTP